MKRTALIILSWFIAVSSFASMQCTITGEVVNRDSKILLLRKRSQSFRAFLNNPVKIPIEKGRFSYTFTYNEIEAYDLIFEEEFDKGLWKSITFFPANGKVELKLYSFDEWDKNTIKGGELNAEYFAYRMSEKKLFEDRNNELMEIQNDLSEKDELESDKYKDVLEQLRAHPNDPDARVPIYQKMDELEKTQERYTETAKQLFLDPYNALVKDQLQWKYEYIRNNVSFVSYYLMWHDVEMQMEDNAFIAGLVTDVFPIYENEYPGHIYTKLIGTQIAGLHTIKPGHKYIDFTAPSIDGDIIQLSDVIEDHVALIDMWGSWCGPCIAKSRLVVPIYNQYKDKGFVIVGIAREFNNTDAVKNRLSKEQFSWLNLVELDDKQNIWNLYGISNGTGLMVLVDMDGTILAVDPKAEELEGILSQKLD